MEHAAIDLGRPYSVVCYLEEGRKVVRRFRLNTAGLDRWFKGRQHSRVLIESSTESEWVARHLESLGHAVVVADPNYAAMYAERTRRVKTDNRDAEALFEANRTGVYRPAHRRSDAQRRVIEQLGIRDSLVRARTRWISVMRSMLRREGHAVASGSAERFLARVGAMGLPQDVRQRLDPYAALWSSLNEQIAGLERRIERVAEHDARVRLLQTAPLIGSMRSAAFVAVVDEPRRFRKAHELESYLGLVPSEWSSSERQHKGHITKAGDTRLRWLLVEAAWGILRSQRPECQALRRWAEGIAARRGKKVAVVALARRLAGILWAMLRDEKPFDPTRLGKPSTALAA